MRQPRTFSERLALLNHLNKRQLAEEKEEETDSESGDEAGLGEEDSGSELSDGIDSDDGDSISDSDSEDELGGEDESASPGAGETAPAPPESQPANPSIPAGSPSGATPNPAVPAPSTTSIQQSSTAEVVSQITSAGQTSSASLPEATPVMSNSLAGDARNTIKTVTGVDPASTSLSAEEVNSGEGTAPALSRGKVAGIAVGTLAGISLLIALGIILFKRRKPRGVSVYDRPPPPGVYYKGEKPGSGAPVVQVEELRDNPGGGAARGSADRRVSSWIRGTASMFSARAVTAPAPVVVGGRSNRETGSEAKWG